MSLPAIRAVKERFPEAYVAVLARPWVADLYAGESAIDEVVPYTPRSGFRDLAAKWRAARSLEFDCAILLQNAFEAALVAFLARIPRRIGYDRDGRGLLLTDRIPVPRPGEIPRHERYYYLELLRRAGIIASLPDLPEIRLEVAARPRPMVGVSPGAAYGTAKRWLPERFAEAAARAAFEYGAEVVLFGSAAERDLCESIARQIEGVPVRNMAGRTTLREFIGMAAQCRLFLTNDSGAMHVASALGVPTVAVFGATDHATTGPTGANARVVRREVECSPCLLRECPIDHRCMTRVTVDEVLESARSLWIREAKS